MKDRAIKRMPALILAIIIVIAMMPILPGGMQETYATEADATKLDVAKGSVTINSDSITGKDENGNDVTQTNTKGYYLYSSSQTGNSVTINCDCTIYLGGLDILVTPPNEAYDFGRPNPININGNFNVTLVLVDDKTNNLASQEGKTVGYDHSVRMGSGKAAIRVPSEASLTINGDNGVLNATGAQGNNFSQSYAQSGGGAGIGGNGGYRDGYGNAVNAEASGTITINGGIVNAVGGDDKGYHGAGGAGIGGGGGLYQNSGGASGEITINGGDVTVKAGKNRTFTPIGAGGSGRIDDTQVADKANTGLISVNGGKLILASDMEIYQDNMLTIGANGTLVVENGVKLTSNGAIKYAINYELNGGTNDVNNPEYYTSSKSITLKSPTRPGYIFEGWYIDEDMTKKADDVAIPEGSTGVKTFYAKWLESRTVTFSSNGGSEVASQTVGNGLTVTRPADPTRSGYEFAGWYTDEACTTAYDFSTPVTANIMLYAKWTKAETPAAPNVPSTYEPTVTPSDNGQTTVDKKDPEAGETVTITPTPNDGYEVDSVTVTDKDGRPVEVTKNSDGTWSFTQPAGSVTITVTYKKNEPVTPVVTTDPTMNFKAVPAGKTAEKLTWTKVKGAEGYDVYFAKCGNKLKKIKSTKSLTLKKTRLKKGTTYKYKVRAYKMQDGKKVYITSAYVSHAIAGGYNSRYTDAKSITAAKKSMTLNTGKTVRVKATQKKYKSGRRFLRTSHAALFRYKSTDKSVATVDRNGKVTAKKAGTCTIYIYAQNGMWTRTKVTVK